MININNINYRENLMYEYNKIKNNLGNSNNYINKAITDKNTYSDNNTEKFDPYNSTFAQLIKEDRKLLNEGKITDKDYGCILIHAFISRIRVVNTKLVLTTNSDYSQNWVSTFNNIQQSHKSAGLCQDYDEDERLQKIIEGLE
ncbi:hypothetical protein ACSVC9_10255 [Clostridium sp. LBM24168]